MLLLDDAFDVAIAKAALILISSLGIMDVSFGWLQRSSSSQKEQVFRLPAILKRPLRPVSNPQKSSCAKLAVAGSPLAAPHVGQRIESIFWRLSFFIRISRSVPCRVGEGGSFRSA